MKFWLEKINQDEIAEAQSDVLEWMDRTLRKRGVPENVLNDVWDAALKRFALQEA